MKNNAVSVRTFLIGAKPWSGRIVSEPQMDSAGTFWVLVRNGDQIKRVDTDMITFIENVPRVRTRGRRVKKEKENE